MNVILTKNFAFLEKATTIEQNRRNRIIEYVSKFEKFIKARDYPESINNMRKALEMLVDHTIEYHEVVVLSKGRNVDLSAKLSSILEYFGEQRLSKNAQIAMLVLKSLGNQSSHGQLDVDAEAGRIEAMMAGKQFHSIAKSFLINLDFVENIEIDSYNEYLYGGEENQTKLIPDVEKERIDSDSLNVTKNIEIKEVPIYDFMILPNRIFEIPIYQRPYSWTTENVNDLLSDIFDKKASSKSHYFGVIAGKIVPQTVSDKIVKNAFVKIIDGQQRLTTSFILVRAFIDYATEQFYSGKEDGIKKDQLFSSFLERFPSSLSFETWFKNAGASDKENAAFQKIMSGGHSKLDTVAQRTNFAHNYSTIRQWLFSNATSLEELKILFSTFVTKFVVGVIDLQVTPKEEMEVFENINSKGRSLEFYDLVKNYLIGYVSEDDLQNKYKEIAITYNAAVESVYGESKNSEKTKTLTKYVHSFINYFSGEEKSKDDQMTLRKFIHIMSNVELFKVRKDLSSSEFTEFISNFGRYAKLWKLLDDQLEDYRFKNSCLPQLVKTVMHAKITPLFPVFFLIFDKYSIFNEKNEIPASFDARQIEALEKNMKKAIFALSILFIKTGQGDSDTARTFFKMTNEVRKSGFMGDDAMKLFFNGLDLPNFDDVKSVLSEPITSWTARSLLQIVELSIMDYDKTKTFVSRQKVEVEHLLPEVYKKWEKDIIDWNDGVTQENIAKKVEPFIETLGNKTLLSKKLNISGSNGTYADKASKYSKDTSPLTNFEGLMFSTHGQWSFKHIAARTKKIVEILKNEYKKDFKK